MKVILLKNVPGIGQEGEVKEVKDGFARNFLIPQNSALMADKENFKKFEQIKVSRIKEEKTLKSKLLELKTKIENVSVTISMEVKGEDQLYGAVSEAVILKELKNEGIDLEKGQLQMQEPIKKIGVQHLIVKLHPEIEASLKVWIVKK